MLANVNSAIIVTIFLIFTFMKDKIDDVVLEIWQEVRKLRSSQVNQDGEKMQNIWLLIGTVCIGIVWVLREELAGDFIKLIMRQRQSEQMLVMQKDLISNISRKVMSLENQLLRTMLFCQRIREEPVAIASPPFNIHVLSDSSTPDNGPAELKNV